MRPVHARRALEVWGYLARTGPMGVDDVARTFCIADEAARSIVELLERQAMVRTVPRPSPEEALARDLLNTSEHTWAACFDAAAQRGVAGLRSLVDHTRLVVTTLEEAPRMATDRKTDPQGDRLVRAGGLLLLAALLYAIGALWWWALRGMATPVATAHGVTFTVLAITAGMLVATGMAEDKSGDEPEDKDPGDEPGIAPAVDEARSASY